ncbi:MAG TPA: helix-turn-helix domain-containing protein [Acidimicrobiales bacterium]|nr:helix-turn-helix domain-containing protein [Acidimicrobiales bacterium]
MSPGRGDGEPALDRAAAVRVALRRLVAQHGFHGASMSAVAAEAGVATGTAYVHYRSKDDLVLAAYVEVKRDLGHAAVARLDPARPVPEQFRSLWRAVHDHLDADRDRARFLVQVEASPYVTQAHTAALEAPDDPLLAAIAGSDLGRRLAPLPMTVLYDLGIGPAVRLAASSTVLPPAELDAVADACWRAISLDPGDGDRP